MSVLNPLILTQRKERRMNRQIKFRGRRLPNDWYYGSLDLTEREPKICFQDAIEEDGEVRPFTRRVAVDEATIGQYTGLDDKNGVGIYEGDIIVLDSWTGKHVVMFADGAFCFKEIGDDIYYSNDIHYTHHAGRKQAHVIGNIYDNKELLITSTTN